MGKTAKEGIATRELSASDLKVVQAIGQESFHDSWAVESWLAELNSSITKYIVLEQEGIIKGFAGFWLIAGEAQVTRVAVAKDERGKGLGKMLTEALVAAAWKEGAEAVTLEVRKSNLTAQTVYAKTGFTVSGVRPNYYEDNREDAIIMWLYR
ncbi:Ribosomal-protein-alanine acetyltransferase [bioreactor metagenome]|uniref:Ribosomal-protein-alanine acetyltransferase n=1 Tax=bioreactor metagenome TaxID=1076179 RepID=A0A645FIT0_9ZZZZ